MKNILMIYKKVHKSLSNNYFLPLILGYTIGALTNIYPKIMFIVFAILTIVFIIVILNDKLKSEKAIKKDSFEERLRGADRHAQERVINEGECLLVVGQAIEIWPHPTLNKQSKINELGWRMNEVLIHDMQKPFNGRKILNDIEVIDFEPSQVDGDKYSLVKISGGLRDNTNLVLDICNTRFSTVISVQQAIKDNLSLRIKYGSIEPEKNGIPHSLCLHYIVRFDDGDILCMKRNDKLVYYPNLWSFTGEEQLSGLDLETTQAIDSLFRRALCEEVLPLMGNEADYDNFIYVDKLISEKRLWSIFIEEKMFSYSLMGFYQLNCNKEGFVQYYNDLINNSVGARDKEGKLYVMTENELKLLLYEGRGVVENIFSGDRIKIFEQDLHPSSRYRIFRLLKAIRRGALTNDYFSS